MKLKLICDDLELSGADGLEQSQYDQAYEIANLSGIRISRDKELSIVAALEEYNSLSSEFQRSYIRVWVVNPKLAKYLENNFGFESDGEWSQSNPFMEYHG